MVIQTIINQGELNQDLLLLNNERYVSGNLQVLKLKEIKAAAPIPAPSDLVIVKNMMYEYTFKSYQADQQDIELEQNPSRIPSQILQEPEVWKHHFVTYLRKLRLGIFLWDFWASNFFEKDIRLRLECSLNWNLEYLVQDCRIRI